MKKNRNAFLDLIKVIAISLIVLFHCVSLDIFNTDSISRSFISEMWLVVDLFFVISGYLFVSKYKNAQFSIAEALKSRYLYILPMYYFFMLLGYFGKKLLIDDTLEFNLSYLFLFQNFLPSIPFYGISWFLCVLEHSLIVLILILFFIKSDRYRLAICIVLSLIPPLLRNLLVEHGTDSWNIYYRMTITHNEGIFIGAIIALRKDWLEKIPVGILSGLAAVFFIYMVVFRHLSSDFYNYYAYTVTSLLSVPLIVLSLRINFNFIKSAIITMSGLAYVVFLSHPIILQVLRIALPKNDIDYRPWVTLVTCWLSAYIISIAYSHTTSAGYQLKSKLCDHSKLDTP